MRTFRLRAGLIAVVLGAIGALVPPSHASAEPSAPTRIPIEHFIFLMQGDRSFDNYFGTFPGADGIPDDVCMPRVLGADESDCVKPFPLHGSAVERLGAGESVLAHQVNNGRMDGFIDAYRRQGRDGTSAMGYYDERDLATYWDIARQYVLFDRFFSSTPLGIRVNRSYWVAAAPPGTDPSEPGAYGDQLTIFDQLTAAGVSWKFYVENYDPTETYRAATDTDPASQTVRVPLLNYARFLDDPALNANIVDLREYYRDLEQGTLPAVAFVTTSGANERTAGSMAAGQALVRTMLNRLMLSRYWERSAFLWSYDGSGGWYDHVVPPVIDGVQAGLRVPAILVSPYARPGYIDHTQLDYTSALKFVEYNWGLPPLTSRDATAESISSAFDFTAPPRAPRILSNGPAVPELPAGDTAMIYGWYGGALVFALGLLAAAAYRSRPPGELRRPGPPARTLPFIARSPLLEKANRTPQEVNR